MISLATARIKRLPSTRTTVVLMTIAAALTIVVVSLYGEFSSGTARYLKSVHANYWLMEPGTTNLGTASTISHDVLPQVRSRPEVAAADGLQVYFKGIFTPKKPLGAGYIPKQKSDGSYEYAKHKDGVVQSYTPGMFLEPQLKSGHQVVGSRDAVMDGTFAKILGLKLGQQFWVGQPKFLFTLVGTAKNTNSYVLRLVFVSQSAISDMLDHSNNYAAIAVRLRTPSIGRLQPATGLGLLTNTRFIDSNATYYGSFTVGPLGMVIAMLLFSFCVALAIKISGEVNTQKKSLATLRAMGMTAKQLRHSLLSELSRLCVISLIFAIPVALAINVAADSVLTGAQLVLGFTGIAIAALVLVVILLVAPILPLRRIAKTDPALIF